MRLNKKWLAALAAAAVWALAGCDNGSNAVPIPVHTDGGSEGESQPVMVVEVDKVIHLSNREADFGQVVLGRSGSKTIALKNGQEQAITLAVSLEGEGDAFGVSGDGIDEAGNITVEGGQAEYIEVTYTPPKAGEQTATLSLTPQGAKAFVLNLKGEAPVPTATIEGSVILRTGNTKQTTVTVRLDNGIFEASISPDDFGLELPGDSIVSISEAAVTRINNTTARITCTVTAQVGAAVGTTGTISASIRSSALKVYDQDVAATGAFTYSITSITQYEIGDEGPGGGYVFYYRAEGIKISVDGEEKTYHYLECSAEQVGEMPWCPCDYYSGDCNVTTETGIGAGYANTQAILAASHSGGESTATNCAAKACAEYKTATTSAGEWFLPSKDELDEIYRVLVKTSDGGLGLITSDDWTSYYHWSSSRYDNYEKIAWYQAFDYGYQDENNKFKNFCVRAVRAF